MGRIEELAERVRVRWSTDDVLGPGISADDVAALEQRVGRLPDGYRLFLRAAGGQRDSDHDGFLLWLPADVERVNVVLARAGCALDDSRSAIVIADYMQESWYYCMWLEGPKRGRVALVLGLESETVQPELGTFEDFVRAYLTDSARLYPPD